MAPDARLAEALAAVRRYPLLDAIRLRRSRRFALGARLTGAGLGHASNAPPHPLSETEEALLVFAAAGINGFCLSDLPMDGGGDPEGGGGNVMAALTGRTIASADAVHATSLFVINDDATWMIKRPQDFTIREIDELSALAASGDIVEVYRRSRIKVRDGRTSVAREVPTLFPFNKWSTNLAGTTYFLPVGELTAMYINVLLSSFDERVNLYIADERNNFRGAGIARFARSRGGRLHNDPADHRLSPINLYETVVVEFILAEEAFMAHNLSLVEQAMGLGGWTHYATASEDDWLKALGFATGIQKASQVLNAGALKRALMGLLGKNIDIEFPLGLTVDGTDLIRPYCPPYYPTMEAAVLAFIDDKRAGLLQADMAEGAAGTWKDRGKVRGSVPWFSDEAIRTTIDYCTYIHETYGRFPAYYGPTRTTLAHQAHHLDLEFYDRHYHAGAYTGTQARHFDLWHR
jgi:hypothetical protein